MLYTVKLEVGSIQIIRMCSKDLMSRAVNVNPHSIAYATFST